MPNALKSPCAPSERTSVASITCLLVVFGVLMVPHALVVLAPNALSQLPVLFFGFPVPEIVVRWSLMLFYPFTILQFVGPADSPWLYFDLFHCVVGAAGLYLATLRWTGSGWMALPVAALVLPFADSHLVGASALAALAWGPWLLLLAEPAFTVGGRDLALCGALAAIQLLSGSFEVILLTWLCVTLCAGSVFIRGSLTSWASVKRLGAFTLLAFLLAATQVVPLVNVPARFEMRPNDIDVDVEPQNRPVLAQSRVYQG